MQIEKTRRRIDVCNKTINGAKEKDVEIYIWWGADEMKGCNGKDSALAFPQKELSLSGGFKTADMVVTNIQKCKMKYNFFCICSLTFGLGNTYFD